MLRSIIAAVGRAVAIAIKAATDLVLLPIRAIALALFPGLSEPLPIDAECEVNRDLLPYGDPFASAEEVAQERQLEANKILAWAADAAHSGGELPLPDVRPKVRDWLASLSDDELDALVLAGKQAVYGHIHFSVPVAGLPPIEARGQSAETGIGPVAQVRVFMGCDVIRASLLR